MEIETTMKKWIITLIVLVITAAVGYTGYNIFINVASEKIIDQVMSQLLTEEEVGILLQDPHVQQIITEELGPGAADELMKMNAVVPASSTPSSTTSSKGNNTSDDSVSTKEENKIDTENKALPKTKEEAFQLVLSKYSMIELKELATKAQGGVSSEEKVKIKASLAERFSEEELQALKVIGIIELAKKQYERSH
jgi:hypothetical protein